MGKIALIELKIIHLKQEFFFFIVQGFFSKFDLGLQHLIMRFLYVNGGRKFILKVFFH